MNRPATIVDCVGLCGILAEPYREAMLVPAACARGADASLLREELGTGRAGRDTALLASGWLDPCAALRTNGGCVVTACSFCGGPSVKFTPANRDGFDVGPLIWLCVMCAYAIPMVVIWDRLAFPSSHPHAAKPTHAIRDAFPTVSEVRATR